MGKETQSEPFVSRASQKETRNIPAWTKNCFIARGGRVGPQAPANAKGPKEEGEKS